jgi:23S rRNA (cytosine1962-C5)-methyltransferase
LSRPAAAHVAKEQRAAMNRAPTVVLRPRRARPFFGRHPWVFEGAVERVEGDPEPGAAVRVVTHERQFIAHGLYNPLSNICVRLYSWDESRPVDAEMIRRRIARAIRFRERLGLNAPRGACRLVYSESDGLSGLVIDRYADFVVVQFTSLAMARFRQTVVETVCELLAPAGVYCRTERGVGELEGLDIGDGPLAGAEPQRPVVRRPAPFSTSATTAWHSVSMSRVATCSTRSAIRAPSRSWPPRWAGRDR